MKKKQLESVITLIVDHNTIDTYLQTQPIEFINSISQDIITSSTINVSALDINSSNLVEALSSFYIVYVVLQFIQRKQEEVNLLLL